MSWSAFGEHPSLGLAASAAVFFVGFGVLLHYWNGRSWSLTIVSAIVATVIWTFLMAISFGVLPRRQR